MNRVTVVGDGAVGTAAAVALSRKYSVVLAGPPGTRPGMFQCRCSGFFSGSVDLLRVPLGADIEPSTVVCALKAFDIRMAVPFIRRISMGASVCLSNGMGLSSQWGELAGDVEYSILTMGFLRTAPGAVEVTNGIMTCAEGSRAAVLFGETAFPVSEVWNIQDARWAKWYANSVINPIGALTGLPNNRLAGSELGWMIEPLEGELALLMPSSESLAEGRKMLRWLLENSTNRCSMLQDIEAGGKTEIDYLTGLCLKNGESRSPIAGELVHRVRRLGYSSKSPM